jgi:hypothetical protein
VASTSACPLHVELLLEVLSMLIEKRRHHLLLQLNLLNPTVLVTPLLPMCSPISVWADCTVLNVVTIISWPALTVSSSRRRFSNATL